MKTNRKNVKGKYESKTSKTQQVKTRARKYDDQSEKKSGNPRTIPKDKQYAGAR